MAERIKLPVNPEEHNTFINEFKAWYRKAKPLEMFVYYHGHHLHESLASSNIKHMTWELACEGKIYLFQRRDIVERGLWEFICQKSSRVIPRFNPARTAKEIAHG